MVPTSLPELPKPSRTPGKTPKPEFANPNLCGKIYGQICNFPINSSFGPYKGGIFSFTARMTHEVATGKVLLRLLSKIFFRSLGIVEMFMCACMYT